MYPDLTVAAIAGHRRRTGLPVHDGIAIEVVAETGSTNADLLARIAAATAAAATAGATVDAAAGADGLQPTLLVARRQTAGRGRAGRSWHADAGSLTFSLAWRFARPLSGLVGLPLAVGVALAEVLRARGVGATLKWPNDLLLDGAKLGGILIETAATPGRTWAVVGIGINLASDPGAGATAALQVPGNALPVARLPATDRNRLLAELLDALSACLQQFDAAGFAPWTTRWNALHAFAGQEVRIVDRERMLHAGRAAGVDEMGRLLLNTETGAVAVMAGDVSLRAAGLPEAG